MKTVRDMQKHLSQQIKTPPERKQSQHKLQHFHQSAEMKAFRKRGTDLLRKTIAAQEAIVMLDYAFPAEEAAAFRTTSHSLARCMMKTALLNEFIGHSL